MHKASPGQRRPAEQGSRQPLACYNYGKPGHEAAERRSPAIAKATPHVQHYLGLNLFQVQANPHAVDDEAPVFDGSAYVVNERWSAAPAATAYVLLKAGLPQCSAIQGAGCDPQQNNVPGSVCSDVNDILPLRGAELRQSCLQQHALLQTA